MTSRGCEVVPSGQSLVSCIVGRACKPVNGGGAVMDLRRSCGVVDDSRGTNLGGGRGIEPADGRGE